jgi:hypothetical protein
MHGGQKRVHLGPCADRIGDEMWDILLRVCVWDSSPLIVMWDGVEVSFFGTYRE